MILTILNKITVTFHNGYPPLEIEPEKERGMGNNFFTEEQMKRLPSDIVSQCNHRGMDVESIRFQGNGVECEKFRDGYLVKLKLENN